MSNNNYINDLKKVVNNTVSEIEKMPIQKLTDNFTTETVKEMILPKLIPLQEALKEVEGEEFGKIEEKAHNIHSIKKLRNAVSDTIKEIESIPKFKTEIEGKSWSSEQLKATIMPLLAQSQNRINDIENVANQIDSVRNEILEPVKKLIEEKDRNSTIFSWIGIVIGIIGIAPLIWTYLSNFKSKQEEKPPVVVNKDNGGFSEEDMLRLGTTFEDFDDIDTLKSLFALGLIGEDFSPDAASNIIRNNVKNPDNEEIKMLIGVLFYLNGDYDYSKQKMKDVASEYLLNDKNLILRLINLNQGKIDESENLPIDFNDLWLPIAKADAEEMLKKEKQIKRQKLRICIYDGSAGKGRLTTSEGRSLKSYLEGKKWSNVSVSSFDYGAYNLKVSNGARSQIWVRDTRDEILKEFKKDLRGFSYGFMNANSSNPDYPTAIQRMRSECNSPDVVILIGI